MTNSHQLPLMRLLPYSVENNNDDDAAAADDDELSNLASRLLSPFGQEQIRDLSTFGNSTFAHGTFGEISIGLRKETNYHHENMGNSLINHNNYETHPFVAIKKIENAMATWSSGRGLGYSVSQNDDSPPQLSKEVFNELLALQLLYPHPNIVSLLAVYPPIRHSEFDSTRSLALVFEYSPIDLHQVLEWRKRKQLPSLSVPILRTIFQDILSAVAHCHINGVLHGDIKPGNLLLSSNGIIQLCDFGLSTPFVIKDESHRPIPTAASSDDLPWGEPKGLCTLFYRPPEILFGSFPSHPSADLFSTGLVLAELWIGTPLWQGQNVLGQLSLMFDALGTPDETTWPTVGALPDYIPFHSKRPAKSWTDTLMLSRRDDNDSDDEKETDCGCFCPPPFVDIISKMAVLNPDHRLDAQIAWHQLQSINKTEVLAEASSRSDLLLELLQPSSLQISSPLPSQYHNVPSQGYDVPNGDNDKKNSNHDDDDDDDDDDILVQRALQLAKTRRTFLCSTNDDTSSMAGPTKTLQEWLTEFSNKDLTTLAEEQAAAAEEEKEKEDNLDTPSPSR
jgi:negative regulator of the PHO system